MSRRIQFPKGEISSNPIGFRTETPHNKPIKTKG